MNEATSSSATPRTKATAKTTAKAAAISDKFHGRSNFTLRDVSRIADFFDVSTDLVLGREPLEVK